MDDLGLGFLTSAPKNMSQFFLEPRITDRGESESFGVQGALGIPHGEKIHMVCPQLSRQTNRLPGLDRYLDVFNDFNGYFHDS